MTNSSRRHSLGVHVLFPLCIIIGFILVLAPGGGGGLLEGRARIERGGCVGRGGRGGPDPTEVVDLGMLMGSVAHLL